MGTATSPQSPARAGEGMRVDAHAHVFARGLPLAEGRRYAPGYDAPLDAYLKTLDALGLTHGVLVQPSFLGTDNGYMLAALAAAPERLRGIAVVDPGVPRDELERLTASGVVGIRLNLIGAPTPDLAREPWRRLMRRVVEAGLHVEVQSEAARLAGLLPPLLDAGTAVVVDHFGLPDPTLGVDDPSWRAVVARAADEPRMWLKLSGAYRLGPDGATLASRLAPMLCEAFTSRRLVFGTDWPHTRFEGTDRAPDALDDLGRWLPDAGDQSHCLGAAARELFGFDPSPGADVRGGAASRPPQEKS